MVGEKMNVKNLLAAIILGILIPVVITFIADLPSNFTVIEKNLLFLIPVVMVALIAELLMH
jgi:hypothetical protein